MYTETGSYSIQLTQIPKLRNLAIQVCDDQIRHFNQEHIKYNAFLLIVQVLTIVVGPQQYIYFNLLNVIVYCSLATHGWCTSSQGFNNGNSYPIFAMLVGALVSFRQRKSRQNRGWQICVVGPLLQEYGTMLITEYHPIPYLSSR